MFSISVPKVHFHIVLHFYLILIYLTTLWHKQGQHWYYPDCYKEGSWGSRSYLLKVTQKIYARIRNTTRSLILKLASNTQINFLGSISSLAYPFIQHLLHIRSVLDSETYRDEQANECLHEVNRCMNRSQLLFVSSYAALQKERVYVRGVCWCDKRDISFLEVPR